VKKLLISIFLILNQNCPASDEFSYYDAFSEPFEANSIVDASEAVIAGARDTILNMLDDYANAPDVGSRVFYMTLIQTQLSNDHTTAGIGNSSLFNQIFPNHQAFIKQKLQELLRPSLALAANPTDRVTIVEEINMVLELEPEDHDYEI
jgi:hypothetical protein